MIGIYGGTFDPVHFGHLRPALDVYSNLGLSKILFIPCGQPPHRDSPIAAADDRLAMLSLALQGQPNFIVDDREVRRAGPSYMVDTLDSLIEEITDENFCLILGMDAFVQLDSWKDWRRLTDLTSLVITQRPEVDAELMLSDSLRQYVNEKRVDDKTLFIESKQTHCLFYPVTQLDISATKIRKLVHDGISIDYLVPEKVAGYIHDRKLYS